MTDPKRIEHESGAQGSEKEAPIDLQDSWIQTRAGPKAPTESVDPFAGLPDRTDHDNPRVDREPGASDPPTVLDRSYEEQSERQRGTA